MLQIYFDFSGYSDMAIGLGRMLGFTFPENFNLPYLSRSIREFWRRWHISLSTWFKEYLYIPLGGNRKGKARTYVNLCIVFLATGIWHGAGPTFVIWGAYHGFFMVLERLGFGRVLDRDKTGVFCRIYALLVVLFGWVLFRAEMLGIARVMLMAMVIPTASSGSLAYLSLFSGQVILAAVLGILLCGPLQAIIARKKHREPVDFFVRELPKGKVLEVAESLFLLAVFALCVVNLAASAYNPFIYFRF